MSNREEQLEIVLKQLLTKHFFKKELEWGWREGVSIQDVDFDLYIQIHKLLPEIRKLHES